MSIIQRVFGAIQFFFIIIIILSLNGMANGHPRMSNHSFNNTSGRSQCITFMIHHTPLIGFIILDGQLIRTSIVYVMTMIFSIVVYSCLLYGVFINSGILAASFQPSSLILEAPQSLEFLKRYGYLDSNTNNDRTAEQLYSQESVETAIREAQRFGGIQQTGKLDEETKKLFSSKRCGLPDVAQNSTEIQTNNDTHSNHHGHYHNHHHHHHHHHQHNHHRNKRYVIASRGWEKRHLTYFLENWPPQLNRHDVMSEIRRAFEAWAKYGQLTFTEVSNTRDSDINIGFFRGSHGDSFPFDGPGKILGHAFYPTSGGDVHFDSDETWKIDPDDFDEDEFAVDFASVLLHELGHSLGISHSPEPDSIMNPYYKGKGSELGYDDILAMHELYITRQIPDDDNRVDRVWPRWDDIPRSPPRQPYFPPRYPVRPQITPRYHETTTIKPRTTTRPCTPYHYGDRENDDYDEGVHRPVDTDDDKNRRNNDRPYKDEPYTPVVDACGNPEEGIDSGSFIRGELFITKGEMLWRLSDAGKVVKDYPVKFHRFFHKLPETVKTIDALYERPDASIVFFYGREYWIFDGYNFIEESPRSISDYGLSEYDERVDAIFYSPEDAYTYVFRGDKYWKFNETTQSVESGYPSFISDFKGTPSHLNAALIDRNGEIYLFKGDTYWTLDLKQKLARKTGSVFQYWLSC